MEQPIKSPDINNNIKTQIAKAFFGGEQTKEDKMFFTLNKVMFALLIATLLTCFLATGIGIGINDTVLPNWTFIFKDIVLSLICLFNLGTIGIGIYYLTLLHKRENKFNKMIHTVFVLLIVIFVFMFIASGTELATVILGKTYAKQPYVMVMVLIPNLVLFLTTPIAFGIIRSFGLQKRVIDASMHN